MEIVNYKKNMKLRQNQIDAIQKSIDNDFSSGIHYHATGTGKSWIAMYLVLEFHKKYPRGNVIWICERKDILTHQFSKDILKERGFDKIISNFNFLEFVSNKNPKWYESLNSASMWEKPFLCIINRSYLTTRKKYEHIKTNIDLIIHDECHTIENTTTQQFYKWLSLKQNTTKIIGFSATPEKMFPLQDVISKYSIYDGFCDNVILPPKIVWIKSDKKIKQEHLINLIQKEVLQLPYQKIIVWCGMIEECIKVAEKWKPYFENYQMCIDFNNISKVRNNARLDLGTFQDFYASNGHSILFCAVKHREGSDIPNVDGCIFMDLVEKRSERVFIQCMGRVLRKDKLGRKKYGLVLDLKAKSTIEICNRVQYYLKLENVFPWKYEMKKVKLDKKTHYINSLMMSQDTFGLNIKEIDFQKKYSIEEIKSYFVRKLPEGKKYLDRLQFELDMIIEKNLFGNMKRALEILEITKNIPHVTRGSCGSSLVCFLLGISHMDPVQNDICFARFINSYRDTLPDIDFDFPHYLRDEVFLKLFQKWGNKVARISNHNYYHEKSALRESLRRNGIRKFISKFDLEKEIRKLDKDKQEEIYKVQNELDGTFRGFSLHCGGIIYFPDGIPQENLLDGKNKSIIRQVNFNRDDVSSSKSFKIDILSSRALSQLMHCQKKVDFNSHIGDPKTIELLCSGNNIGITLAETPLMRKALLLVKPKSIMDLAICLSIIRPAAKDARREFELGKYKKDNIIFDDDVITIISKLTGCTQEMADKIRRGYAKGDSESLLLLDEHLWNKTALQKFKIKSMLNNLRKYGFCKAHAISYAQLVWQLAYQKAHFPKKFWRGTLKNVDTCYRNWVHLYEAKCVGINVEKTEKHKSIYAKQRNRKQKECDDFKQMQKYGTWNMHTDSFYKGCYYKQNSGTYYFCGLVASSKILKFGKTNKLVLFIGVRKNKYIEVLINGKCKFNSQKVIVKGYGKMKNELYNTIECYSNNLEFL